KICSHECGSNSVASLNSHWSEKKMLTAYRSTSRNNRSASSSAATPTVTTGRYSRSFFKSVMGSGHIANSQLNFHLPSKSSLRGRPVAKSPAKDAIRNWTPRQQPRRPSPHQRFTVVNLHAAEYRWKCDGPGQSNPAARNPEVTVCRGHSS